MNRRKLGHASAAVAAPHPRHTVSQRGRPMTAPADWAWFAEMTGGASGALTGLLFVASGGILACGQPAGLYLLLSASLVAEVSGVLNAWYFLLGPG
jgi:hypothetical protein